MFEIKTFKMIKKLGSGSFGEVFLGEKPDGTLYALKVEPKVTEKPQLVAEAKICQAFKDIVGFPQFIGFERTINYNVLITNVLGPSLEQFYEKKRFSDDCICTIAYQVLERLQIFHEKDYIHRDIKPENFLLTDGILHMIDFGLSKKFRHTISKNNKKYYQHNIYTEGGSLVGTPRYASIRSHQGIETSRRDDLESLGYMLIYFLNGSLPWQGQEAKTKKEKYRKIMDIKIKTRINDLCVKMPVLIEYFNYIKFLYFEDTPNYSFLKSLFKISIIDLRNELISN